MEFMLTFLLVIVVLRTAVDKDNMGNFAPIAIGFAVLIDHIVGSVCVPRAHAWA